MTDEPFNALRFAADLASVRADLEHAAQPYQPIEHQDAAAAGFLTVIRELTAGTDPPGPLPRTGHRRRTCPRLRQDPHQPPWPNAPCMDRRGRRRPAARPHQLRPPPAPRPRCRDRRTHPRMEFRRHRGRREPHQENQKAALRPSRKTEPPGKGRGEGAVPAHALRASLPQEGTGSVRNVVHGVMSHRE